MQASNVKYLCGPVALQSADASHFPRMLAMAAVIHNGRSARPSYFTRQVFDQLKEML